MQPEPSASRVIEALGLEPLPNEGGFFRQTWRGKTSSAIFFLLAPDNFSALHRLDRDEIWHFYAGQSIEHWQLDPSTGEARCTRMGADVLDGEEPQLVVPAGVWQGARLDPRASSPTDFALLGCTVSPPWDEEAFSLADRDELIRRFPRHETFIHALTR